jgi:hypothetical protein
LPGLQSAVDETGLPKIAFEVGDRQLPGDDRHLSAHQVFYLSALGL